MAPKPDALTARLRYLAASQVPQDLSIPKPKYSPLLMGLMKIHDDYEKFYAQLNQIAPIYPDNPTLFDNPKDWDIPRLKG
jgi:hypothetical protein